jgi:hypothetical protein
MRFGKRFLSQTSELMYNWIVCVRQMEWQTVRTPETVGINKK